jgi:hypothetical protein
MFKAITPSCRHSAVLSLVLAAAQMALCLPALAQTPANVKSITTTLTTSAARKECINVTPQQRIHYWYRAEAPVSFVIQYVQGKETLYPVKKDKLAIGSGTYQPKAAEVHCLVWTNLGKQPVNLSFEFARLGAN